MSVPRFVTFLSCDKFIVIRHLTYYITGHINNNIIIVIIIYFASARFHATDFFYGSVCRVMTPSSHSTEVPEQMWVKCLMFELRLLTWCISVIFSGPIFIRCLFAAAWIGWNCWLECLLCAEAYKIGRCVSPGSAVIQHTTDFVMCHTANISGVTDFPNQSALSGLCPFFYCFWFYCSVTFGAHYPHCNIHVSTKVGYISTVHKVY